MKLRQRLILLTGMIVAFSLYIPINRLVSGGRTLAVPLDAFIPVWPAFVFPYLLALPWWAGCVIWAVARMDSSRLRVFGGAFILCNLIASAIYILYPTYVVRPLVAGADIAARVLNLVYANDRPYNAFPSGHTFTTVLIFLAWLDWKPRLAWLWGTIGLTILAALLFVHQHYLADLLGGIFLAMVVFLALRFWNLKAGRRIPCAPGA
jgi:membrane-associated phospholipid phosphatase